MRSSRPGLVLVLVRVLVLVLVLAYIITPLAYHSLLHHGKHEGAASLGTWILGARTTPPSLSLGCKRLRPLAPKLDTTTTTNTTTNATTTVSSFDLKSFIRPESGPRKFTSSDDKKDSPPQQVETHPGGTRWNPTQEQIGILEMLYRGGMRTPNAQQIEQITAQLSRYGKIEGKNVFYWFQNHKARERQKQKRNSLGLSHCPRTPPPQLATTAISLDTEGEVDREEDSPYKRKCKSWGFECLDLKESRTCREEGDRTLELFPLHPEGR